MHPNVCNHILAYPVHLVLTVVPDVKTYNIDTDVVKPHTKLSPNAAK